MTVPIEPETEVDVESRPLVGVGRLAYEFVSLENMAARVGIGYGSLFVDVYFGVFVVCFLCHRFCLKQARIVCANVCVIYCASLRDSILSRLSYLTLNP